MLLHPPATAYLDKVWSDLRVGLPNASLIVHTPAGQKRLRPWERIESGADEFLPGTATMRLAPASQFKDLDLLTVFAIGSGIEKKEFAFKLLQSTSAIGVRIHREGLPTLVAFKTNPAAGDATLTGFSFSGPVGVSVFKPKKTR